MHFRLRLVFRLELESGRRIEKDQISSLDRRKKYLRIIKSINAWPKQYSLKVVN